MLYTADRSHEVRIKQREAKFKHHSSAVNWHVLHGNVSVMLPAPL